MLDPDNSIRFDPLSLSRDRSVGRCDDDVLESRVKLMTEIFDGWGDWRRAHTSTRGVPTTRRYICPLARPSSHPSNTDFSWLAGKDTPARTRKDFKISMERLRRHSSSTVVWRPCITTTTTISIFKRLIHSSLLINRINNYRILGKCRLQKM